MFTIPRNPRATRYRVREILAYCMCAPSRARCSPTFLPVLCCIRTVTSSVASFCLGSLKVKQARSFPFDQPAPRGDAINPPAPEGVAR
jgi:hypothetical protein